MRKLSVKEALIVTHCKLCLQLSERLDSNAHYDKKSSTAEGEYANKVGSIVLGEGCAEGFVYCANKHALVNPCEEMLKHVRTEYLGKNRDYAKEESSRKSDLAEDLLDVFSGRSALSDTGDRSALSLKVIGYLDRIKGDLSIEVCKAYDKNEESDRINYAVCADDLGESVPAGSLLLGDPACALANLENGGKEGDDRGCEDDRHNACHVELDRKIRALSAVHLTSDNLLCVLNGNSSLGSGEPDNDCDKNEQECYKHNREYGGKYSVEPSVLCVAVGGQAKINETVNERGNCSYDIREEYHGDTVADAALVNSFGKPHDERGAGNIAKNDYYRVKPGNLALGSCLGEAVAVKEKEVVSYSRNNSKNNRHYSCNKAHLLLVVLGKLAELREYDSKKLNNN